LILKHGDFDKQCSLLQSVISSPDLAEHIKNISVSNTANNTKIKCFDNVVELLSNSAPSSPRKGNFTNDQRVIHDVLMMYFVDTVPTENIEESNTSGHNSIFMHKRKHLDQKWMAKALNMPRGTLNKKLQEVFQIGGNQ